MPETHLTVSEEDPVNLDGSIDSAGALQILHGSDSLVDYMQTLLAVHEDLEDPSEVIRIKLRDFSYGGATWQLTATHVGGGGTVNWSRAGDHCYHDFGEMTSLLDVDVTATSNGSPPQTKTRTIKLKAKSDAGLPDRPRSVL